jgi:hypothetical protein
MGSWGLVKEVISHRTPTNRHPASRRHGAADLVTDLRMTALRTHAPAGGWCYANCDDMPRPFEVGATPRTGALPLFLCRRVSRVGGCRPAGGCSNLPAELGAWSEPTDPAVTCSRCGEYPPEVVRLRLAIERMTMSAKPLERLVRAQAAPRPAPAPASSRERRPPPGLGLGINKAARQFQRSKATITRLIDEGSIATIPWTGKKTTRLIPLAEVERIEREGLARPEPAPPTPKKNRERRNCAAATRAEREAALNTTWW